MANTVEEVLELAAKLSQEEDNEGAVEHLKRALERYQGNIDLETMLGVIYARMNMDDDSERVLKSVLSKSPSHEKAVSAMGHLLNNTLRTNEAEKLYRETLDRKPSGPCVMDDLCRLLVTSDKTNEAYRESKNHAERYPEDELAYDALRYVLHNLESSLDREVDDSSYDPDCVKRLLSNFFEQFETIQKLKALTDELGMHEELNEDLVRLAGEAEYMLSLLQKEGSDLDDDLGASIDLLIDKGGSLRP